MAELQNGELLKEIYDKVSNIQTKVEVLHEKVAGDNGLVRQVSKQDERLTFVEKWNMRVAGGLTLLAVLIPLLIKFLGK